MNSLTKACLSCADQNLKLILSLGNMPLANSLLTKDQLSKPEPIYPLELAFCRNCTLVQILESVSPDTLFREYVYFSSFSDTMLRHAETLVKMLIARQQLTDESFVVEIASNDGYLLQYYKAAGITVLGVEPALNIAEVARTQRGIPTISEFFEAKLAQQIIAEKGNADIIHAHNVLAHVPDLNGVVEGFRLLLKAEGRVVVEAPYVKNMIDHAEFDTIYHEHLCYFSLTTLDKLFERHGLIIEEVERLAIHGGSLRIIAGLAATTERGQSVLDLLAEEKSWQVDQFGAYQQFADRVNRLREILRQKLTELKAEGKRVAAYGAAAKGSTLLNYFGIGQETLDFVADRSTYKQGHYMPGVHLPIYAPTKILEIQPDYLLILAWNFADEIIAQQTEYQVRGGRFIVPLPEFKVV
jgi:SAM-dependent methyltransferase